MKTRLIVAGILACLLVLLLGVSLQASAQRLFALHPEGPETASGLPPIAPASTFTPPGPPESVTLIGPTSGNLDGPQLFTATVAPLSATTPITWVWEATEQAPVTRSGALSDTLSFGWETPGLKAITVTATNAEGMAVGYHAINIRSSDAFTVCLPLTLRNLAGCAARPTLLSPSDASQLSTIVPLLEWDNGAATGVTYVRLEIATDVDFDQTIGDISYVASPGVRSYRFARNLSPATTYYWRAWFVCDDNVPGPYTDAWSFTTGSGGTFLPAPALTSPANGTAMPSTEVTLQWSPVAGAQGYLVNWSAVGSTARAYTWVTGTERVLRTLTPGTAYEWWIAAYNDYALGADSAKWLFTLPSATSTTSSPPPVEAEPVEIVTRP